MSFKKLLLANRRTAGLGVFLSIAPVLVSSAVSAAAYAYGDRLAGFGIPEKIFLYLLLSFSMSFSLTPTTFVSLLSGYFFSWASLPYLLASYTAASYWGYRISAFVDGGNFLDDMKEVKGFADFSEKVKEKPFWAVFFARLSPALPFGLMNFSFALLRVPPRMFLTAGAFGMLPRTCLAVLIGSQAEGLRALISGTSKESPVWLWATVALVIVSTVAMWRIFRSEKRKVKSEK